MKPVVMKLSRKIEFSRPMELNDLKEVFWGYINRALQELQANVGMNFHYLLFMFFSGVETYMIYSITDPEKPPAARGHIAAPVNAGTIEITMVAAGIDYGTLEDTFVKHAAAFRRSS
jgi:hypothetical protein